MPAAEPFPYHNLQLEGNVGSDPEMRHTQGGASVVEVSLAVYDGKDQNDEPKTVWWKIQAYKGVGDQILAEIKKGDRLRVRQGKAEFQVWTDRQTGQIRTRSICKAWEVERVKREPRQQRQQTQSPAQEPDYDDIPF